MYKKRYKLGINRAISKSSNEWASKGQVTVFIILGLLMLIAVALVLLLQTRISTIENELAPTEKGKVESFISSCIKNVGEEALLQLGAQGGYIEIPEQISSDPGLHLPVSPFTLIPYWAYGEVNAIPPIEEIKERIDIYVENNLRSCLFEMEVFQEVFDIREKSEIISDVEILDNKVRFKVYWNVEVRDKAGAVISEVLNHDALSLIKFGRVYDVAKKIVERELETLKLEDITQDLIALEHKDVPVAGVDFSCSKKKWKVNEVQQGLKDLLRVNIRELKASGTEFVNFPEELPYYQSHYIWDMGPDFEKKDISVVFNFDERYPFTFQVTPLENGIMQSSTQSGSKVAGVDLLSFLCIQTWKFTYDVSFPVTVRVKDEGSGYNFNMAFTVHLVRNFPDRKSQVFARPSSLISFPTSEKYCSNTRVPMTVTTRKLVQSDEFGVYDTTELEDVDISFTCLKYRCEMGYTDFNFAENGNAASLSVDFPYCVGGILRGEKEGYLEDWKRVVTEEGKEVELNLIPFFKVPVNKFKIVKHDALEPALEESLRSEEMALVTVTQWRNGTKFHEFQQVVGGSLSDFADNLEAEFLGEADFKYEVAINLFDGENLIGGYKGNWTVPWSDLQTAQEIVFHTVALPDGSQDETFALLLDLTEQSKLISGPEIKG
jgi:hypothetical protein